MRAVTLDAAGTLFAPREPVGETYARVARRHGITAEASVVDDRFRRAMRSAPPLAFPGVAAARRPAFERAWWASIVATALGVPDADPRLPPCVDALFLRYAQADAWSVFDDVVPALQALRVHGFGLAVVSNFDGRLPDLLASLGLAHRFDAVLWSTMADAAKPAPGIFRLAAHRLDVDVSATCHVGDDPEADVAGARAAGAMAVHLDRRGTPGVSSDVIVTLVELTPWLAKR